MAYTFADEIVKCIFVNEKFSISIRIYLEYVPKGPINNKTALVKVMAWRQPLLWLKLTQFVDAYIRHLGDTS